jgi:hypothetical protein
MQWVSILHEPVFSLAILSFSCVLKLATVLYSPLSRYSSFVMVLQPLMSLTITVFHARDMSCVGLLYCTAQNFNVFLPPSPNRFLLITFRLFILPCNLRKWVWTSYKMLALLEWQIPGSWSLLHPSALHNLQVNACEVWQIAFSSDEFIIPELRCCPINVAMVYLTNLSIPWKTTWNTKIIGE